MGTDIHLRAQVRRQGEWHDEVVPSKLLGWRNYSVFAALAGVRNSDGVPPIAPPRGLPDDLRGAEPDPAEIADCCHDTSWLTLAELQAYDWEGPAWQGQRNCWTDDGPQPVPLHTFTRVFRERFLPFLARLGPAEAVRLVFFFDC